MYHTRKWIWSQHYFSGFIKFNFHIFMISYILFFFFLLVFTTIKSHIIPSVTHYSLLGCIRYGQPKSRFHSLQAIENDRKNIACMDIRLDSIFLVYPIPPGLDKWTFWTGPDVFNVPFHENFALRTTNLNVSIITIIITYFQIYSLI